MYGGLINILFTTSELKESLLFVSRNLKATNQVLTDIKVNCYSVVITTFRNTLQGYRKFN